MLKLPFTSSSIVSGKFNPRAGGLPTSTTRNEDRLRAAPRVRKNNRSSARQVKGPSLSRVSSAEEARRHRPTGWAKKAACFRAEQSVRGAEQGEAAQSFALMLCMYVLCSMSRLVSGVSRYDMIPTMVTMPCYSSTCYAGRPPGGAYPGETMNHITIDSVLLYNTSTVLVSYHT